MSERAGQASAGREPRSFATPVLPQRVVRRQRLLDVLNGIDATPSPLSLVMVVAAAGSGKTVLAAHWARTRDRADAVRWLSETDHDRLLDVLLGAAGLPRAAVDEVTAISGEASEHARALEMLRAAADTPDGPEVVLVDDAHLLAPRQLRFLARILATVPESVRLVLLSRRDLALPVVPLELAGRMRSVRAGQLRFRDEEAKELVVPHAPGATTDDLALLQERTRGWAAALILGARTLHAAEDRGVARALLQSTDQPVLDYLLAEALDALPGDALDVLQVSCGEPELTAESVMALSGRADAVGHLSALARDGLLVTAYPSSSVAGTEEQTDVVWSLHPLLLEFLRRRSAGSLARAGVSAEGHARGVRHARAIGDPVAAVRHAALSEDGELLSEVISDVGPELIVAGEHAVLQSAIDALPLAARRAQPSVDAVHALLARAHGDTTTAIRSAESARAELRTDAADESPRRAALEADLLSLELWQARFGWSDARAAVDAAGHLIAQTSGDGGHQRSGRPPGVSATRACCFLLELAATETWLGDVSAAGEHVTDAIVLARAVRSPRLTASCLALESVLTVVEGRAAAAASLATEAIGLIDEADRVGDVHTNRARVALAWARFYALDLRSAQHLLDEVWQAATTAYEPMTVALGTILRARLLIESGRTDDADRLLSIPMPVPSPMPRFATCLASMTKAHIAAITGADVELRKEIQILGDLGCPDEAALLQAIDDAHHGRFDTALAGLEELADREPRDRTTRTATVTIRLMLMLLSGRTEDARDALPHLLNLVAQDRLLHLLSSAVGVEEPFAHLLYEEVQRPDAHPFAATALAAMRSYRREYHVRHRPDMGFDAVTTEPRVAVVTTDDRTPPPSPRLALTPRELAVLQQLALGGSYGDIAGALFVTVNTVKTHLASVYRKLGVERKAEALQIARDLGLIGLPTTVVTEPSRHLDVTPEH